MRERFLKRLSSEIERRGALDVLRRGLKDMVCSFRLAYFRPASGLNEEMRRLHGANFFAVTRQVRYGTRNDKSLDLVLFLNGIPVFTAELKDPLTGQTVEDAMRQYKNDRDPREPLFAYGRCLAHFAVDPELVYVTTHLAGRKTRFLPFNRGRFGGAGNPPVPPTRAGYPTSYLWDETWARDSVLDLVRQFIHEVEEEHENGRKTGRPFLTRSRLHAARYKRAVDAYLAAQGHPFKALVAFSGTVQDGGRGYTEANMNGAPEAQTARTFDAPEHRFLVVANKFQTGFDQPLLHTMYVDKKLGGVNAVQTLSRLNRTQPEKRGTMVLDFANEADGIKAAFDPYLETTLLSEATDPNLLYEAQSRLEEYPVYAPADVDRFARVWFDSGATQDRLYAALAPVVERFAELGAEEQPDFRGQLTDFVRLYAFLSQVLTFADPDLERLYVFARHLRRLLPVAREELPREVQQNIDMESYRLQETRSGRIELERTAGVLDPIGPKGTNGSAPDEIETLSRIIAELNERFGLELGPEHRVTLGQMMERLDSDEALGVAARVDTRENVRLTFDQKVEQVIQEIVDSNFDLYRRITDDRAFGDVIKNHLFDLYVRGHRSAEELIGQGESMTLEFKSTLRWNLKEDRKDRKGVTHTALRSIAAFLNTEGGDLLLGVADDGGVVGIERDRFEDDDKFMLHLTQAVRNGLGDRAGTCIDPNVQVVDGKSVCVVSCRRSPEPVFLAWKGVKAEPGGDFFVRSGPGTVKLSPEDAREYVRTRFPDTRAK